MMSFEKNFDAQSLLNKMVYDFMKQQRHQRYWQWFKRVLWILLIGFLIYQVVSEVLEEQNIRSHPHVGLININGEIGDNHFASSDNLGKSMSKAYKAQHLKALILRINSPGGSPVQADYMFNLIQYYRQKYPKIHIYSVCSDSCTSAAYYVATATEKIYANPSSLVGSIGVIYNGFGFDGLMQKLGIHRRLMIAGKNKGLMDPFSPESPEQKALMQKMLNEIHQHFIARVKEGRGHRLKIDENTFSGLPWTGEDALTQGLIDGFASAGDLIRNEIKIENVIDYTEKPNVVEQFSKNVGAALPLDIGSMVKQNGFH